MVKPVKIILPLVSILELVLFIATGCCDSGKTSVDNSSDGKIVLEFWNTMEGREAAIMPEVLKAFHQKYPDIQ